MTIAVHYAVEGDGLAKLEATLEAAYDQLNEVNSQSPATVPPNGSLIGIDPEVYHQINAAIQAGKRHIMFYGPPGTGKTTLAQHAASVLSDEDCDPPWVLITGSADWASQDIIGGYQPTGADTIKFMPGILLNNFDKPLVIDELNRCDIDKVIGPLFTVLSGQSTTLPYVLNPGVADSARVSILPHPIPDPDPGVFAPGNSWRIIATINSIDKASLYQMSYALTRRFGWIYIDVPSSTLDFCSSYLRLIGRFGADASPPEEMPIARVWDTVNEIRPIGPAPFIDMMKMCLKLDADYSFGAPTNDRERVDMLSAFYTHLLPMLDGLTLEDADSMINTFVEALNLKEGSPYHQALSRRLRGVAL